jgi:hypothetical protein
LKFQQNLLRDSSPLPPPQIDICGVMEAAHKFKQLIQRFFGHTCLEIDVFDNNGIRHSPRESFIVHLEAIEQAITLIISGDIINFKYDKENEIIKLK